MPSDLIHLLQVTAITVGLAVTVWFASYAAMGWLERTVRRIVSMIRKRRTNIDRRTFPAIAWGIVGLVLALLLVLAINKATRG